MINDLSNVKELSTKDIKIREKGKKKKTGKKEMYKVKGTKLYVTYIGPSRPKKREAK